MVLSGMHKEKLPILARRAGAARDASRELDAGQVRAFCERFLRGFSEHANDMPGRILSFRSML